jgi:alkylation response protein AidB-like acyl-CoA dehydrogenase
MPGLDAETRKMIIETWEEFAETNFPLETLLDLDRKNEFPAEPIRQLFDPNEFGLHLLPIEEKFGGMGGSSYDMYRMCEAIAGVDLGVATSFFSAFLGVDPIDIGGTEEQRKYWFERMAAEGFLAAYGATEPEAGSDLGALRTKAVPVEEDGKITGYRITGRKQWISNGGVAKVYTILAAAPGGPTWFVLEDGVEGFSTEKPEDKHGIRLSHTGALVLEDVFVPVENLLGGKEGQGLRQAQAVFGYTRLFVAALGLGAGWRAVEITSRYSQERVVSGSALSEKQGYTHKLLVPFATWLEASRAFIEDVAERLDGGEKGLQTEGAIAKFMATEAGNAAAEAGIQGLGGYGYTREFEVEKVKRDVRITTIYEGTSEIMEWTIARDRWQEHLKSAGDFYRAMAREQVELHGKHPDVGAGVNANTLNALATILEHCRAQQLTRNQHILFRMGRLIAWAETAAVFSKRSTADEYSDGVKFDQETWKAMARVHAREAAQTVVCDGIRWIVGSGSVDAAQLATECGLTNILQWNQGLLDDMRIVRDALIKRFAVGE